jgi:hypothetical protein
MARSSTAVATPRYTIGDDDEQPKPKFTIGDEGPEPNLPGGTPQLTAAVQAGKTPGAPTQPTALEKQQTEGERGFAAPIKRALPGLFKGPEEPIIADPFAKLAPQGAPQKPWSVFDRLKHGWEAGGVGGAPPSRFSSIGRIGEAISYGAGPYVGMDPQAAEEKAAHGDTGGIVGQAAVPIAQTVGGELAKPVVRGVGEGVTRAAQTVAKAAREAETNKLKPGVQTAAKIAGATAGLAGHAIGVPGAGEIIGYFAGPHAAEALIPKIAEKPVFPGAPLPSAEEFYARRGAEANAIRRMQPQPGIPPIRTSPFEGATATAPGATFATVAPMERPQVATGPTSTSGVPPGTKVAPMSAPEVPRATTLAAPEAGAAATPVSEGRPATWTNERVLQLARQGNRDAIAQLGRRGMPLPPNARYIAGDIDFPRVVSNPRDVTLFTPEGTPIRQGGAVGPAAGPIGTIRTGISMEPQGGIGMIERPTPRVPTAAAPEPTAYAGPERRAAPGAYAGPERRRVGEMLAPTDESARLRNEYKKIAEDPTVSAEERAKAQRAYNETNPSLVGGGGEELEKGMRTARLGEANKGISEIQARDSLMKDPAKKAKFEAADPKAKDRMLIAEKNEMLAVK